MILHKAIDKRGSNSLKVLMRTGKITLAGNVRLKIYGSLSCKSGKRMKYQNRVFFKDEKEARENGFRPCGHCQKVKYHQQNRARIK